jgi:hypothetical protein
MNERGITTLPTANEPYVPAPEQGIETTLEQLTREATASALKQSTKSSKEQHDV